MSEDKALEKAAETLAKVESDKSLSTAPIRSWVRVFIDGVVRFFKVRARTGDGK